MPINLVVSEITVDEQQPPHRRVLRLHGRFEERAGGASWCHTQAAAVNHITGRLFNYFLYVQGRAIGLVVARTAAGEPYLKARGDGDEPTALLALPRAEPTGLEPR